LNGLKGIKLNKVKRLKFSRDKRIVHFTDLKLICEPTITICEKWITSDLLVIRSEVHLSSTGFNISTLNKCLVSDQTSDERNGFKVN